MYQCQAERFSDYLIISKPYLEVPGIEPRAFCLQSKSCTVKLYGFSPRKGSSVKICRCQGEHLMVFSTQSEYSVSPPLRISGRGVFPSTCFLVILRGDAGDKNWDLEFAKQLLAQLWVGER